MEIKVINNLNDDVIKELKKFGEDDSDLNSLNPYGLEETYPKLDEIIEKFLEYHKGNADGVFSWVEELNELAKDSEGENISYNGDSANQHYGLPTHINGDYKNGLIYHCLFNAGTNGVDDSLKTNNCTLEEYYKIPEKERKKGPKDINDIISESEEGKIVENLIHNIIGPESVLTKELKKERKGDERGYYCKQYYKEILKKNKDFYFDPNIRDEEISEMTNNMVNIELYPLRSINQKRAKYSINKFSLFGAYIILYRIGKYLNEVEEDPNIQKPIFIFRSLPLWKDCIIDAIKNHFNFDEDTADELFEYLYDNYFLEFSNPRSGSVSSNNLIKKIKTDNDSLKKEKIGVERFDKIISCLSKPKNSAK